MRHLLLFVLSVCLFTACNRDAVGVESTAPGPVIAPASAPQTRAERDASLARPAALEERPDQLPDNTGKNEPGDAAEVGEEFAAKREGPGRMSPVIRVEPRQASQPVIKPNTSNGSQDNLPLEDSEKSVREITAPIVFSVSKSPCRGFCEMYELRVHDTGEMVLDARRNMRLQGLHTRKLMNFKYSELVGAFQQLEVDKLAEVYPENKPIAADIPATFLDFTTEEGEQKRIEVYHDAPEALAEFLEQIDALVKQGIWEKAAE